MKIFSKLFILIIILFAGCFLWYTYQTSPVNPKDTQKQMFAVDAGSGVKAIAKKLHAAHLIKNETAFYLTVKRLGIESKIQAGDFELSPALSNAEIAQTLTKGAIDIWVTIPEGKRAEEVAQLLKDDGFPNYDTTWATTLHEEEGYLFPDTYLIKRDATISEIMSIFTTTFDQKYAAIVNKTNLSKAQIVILASLIEREAKDDKDRPIVSSVMHNRIDQGMPLQIDATVQYAIGFDATEQTWWKKGLTYDDLKINSAYNTYVIAGLPPKPIANPGIKALIAAAQPDDTPYLFYITDKNGVNHYAKTLAEHNANIKKYGL